jgi:chromosome segregation ATPase
MPDGRTHYCSAQQTQAVYHRLAALGLMGIEGLEEPRVRLVPIERPSPVAAAIDWRALAQEYQADAAAAQAEKQALADQIRSLNGQLGVKQGEIDQLRQDLATVGHSQVATQLAAANALISEHESEIANLKGALSVKESQIDALNVELATANSLLRK